MNRNPTDAEIKEMLREIGEKSIVSAVTLLNFRYAGCRLNVNDLIRNGWIDLSSYCDEGEFLGQESTWIELVEQHGNLEFHASIALSQTQIKPSDSDWEWKTAYHEDSVAAHEMRIERYAFFRQLYIHVLDSENTKYEVSQDKCPCELLDRINKGLCDAVESQAKLLIPDIIYQTDGYEPYQGMSGANDTENRLIILKGLLERTKGNGRMPSVRRLLDPIARAILTKDDPEGAMFISQLSNLKIVSLLLESADYAGDTEVTVALFKLFLENFAKADLSEFPLLSWGIFSIALIYHGLTMCAKYTVENAIAALKADNASDTDILARIAGHLLPSVRRNISNARKLQDFSVLSKMLSQQFTEDSALKVLGPLLDCHAAELDGGDPVDHVGGLKKLFEEAQLEFDDKHKDDKQPWAKTLCQAIKAPLEWQSLVFAACGNSNDALQALPDCPFHSPAFLKRRPPCTVVEGLSYYDIWAGFLPENPSEEDYKELISRISTPLTKSAASERIILNEFNGVQSSGPLEILEEPDPKSTLSALAVKEQDSDNNKGVILAVFPFLPHGRSKAEDITVGSVWEFYPWEKNEAADARIRLDSGDCIYATLPYYAADKWLMPRGFRRKVRLAGFAHAIEKYSHGEDIPKSFIVDKGPLAEEAGHPVEIHMDVAALDWFEQDVFPNYISRSGFNLCGRIKEITTIEAIGTYILSVRIDCRKLKVPFEIFIPAGKVESKLNVGDLIRAIGWIYADFSEAVDSVDEYNKENPNEPPQESDIDNIRSGTGIPTFIRTDLTDEEKKWMPDDLIHPDWMRYAERKLRSMNGVTKVVRCPKNPQRYTFLVRQNGTIRKIAFLIEDSDAVTKDPFVGTEMLILRRIKHGNGLNLEWKLENEKI